jgi:hypothetical protein
MEMAVDLISLDERSPSLEAGMAHLGCGCYLNTFYAIAVLFFSTYILNYCQSEDSQSIVR